MISEFFWFKFWYFSSLTLYIFCYIDSILVRRTALVNDNFLYNFGFPEGQSVMSILDLLNPPGFWVSSRRPPMYRCK